MHKDIRQYRGHTDIKQMCRDECSDEHTGTNRQSNTHVHRYASRDTKTGAAVG